MAETFDWSLQVFECVCINAFSREDCLHVLRIGMWPTFPLRACLVCAAWKAVWAPKKSSARKIRKNRKEHYILNEHVFSLSCCQYLCSARQNESTARGFSTSCAAAQARSLEGTLLQNGPDSTSDQSFTSNDVDAGKMFFEPSKYLSHALLSIAWWTN